MSVAMSEHERQKFAALHVGVNSIERADGPSLSVPISCGYEQGDSCGSSPAATPRGKLLNNARRSSLCVQTEEPPF